MPTLLDVVRVLEEYQGRYEALDAFADDIDELRWPNLAPDVQIVPNVPRPTAEIWIAGRRLRIEVFEPQGIARFRLLPEGPPPQNTMGIAAALGGALGGALGAASAKKEGLLTGVALGMLVGGLLGAALAPPDRALALQFDQVSASWRLYDGPLRAWAKRSLIPTAPAAQ
jgi:hypothetical protein